jgi:hypothetical protein
MCPGWARPKDQRNQVFMVTYLKGHQLLLMLGEKLRDLYVRVLAQLLLVKF